jgi:hypothetical protein
MGLFDIIISSLAYSVAFGLGLGFMIHYILRHYFISYRYKIWQTLLMSWGFFSIIHAFFPKLLESELFRLIGQIIIGLGLYSIYKYYRINRLKD